MKSYSKTSWHNYIEKARIDYALLPLPNMDYTALLDLYRQDEHTTTIYKTWQDTVDSKKLYLTGQSASLISLRLASYYLEHGGNHVLILNDKEEAAYFLNDLQALLPKKDINFLIDSFKRPLDSSQPQQQNIRLRTEAVKELSYSSTRGSIVISYPEALIEKVVRQDVVSQHAIHIDVDKEIDIEAILDQLVELDFESMDFVYEPGQFSQRGGIIDIFSYGNELPYRIELLGDTVSSIRLFNPLNQQSEKKIKRMSIIANIQAEKGQNVRTTFFNTLPANSTIWAKDLDLSFDLMKKGIAVIEAQFPEIEDDEEHIFYGGFEENICTFSELQKHLERFVIIEFGQRIHYDGQKLDYSSEVQPAFNKSFDLLTENLQELRDKGYSILIFSSNARQHERLFQIFEDLEAGITFHPILLSIHGGFIDHRKKIAVYTDHQIFERFHKFSIKKGYSQSQAISLRTLMELQKGDYVSHIDHGVGTFSGLQTLDVNGRQQEAVRLLYKDGDILYVGINALYKISKYAGKEGKTPRINKLGSKSWEKLKNKTKKKVKDIAKDLIQLYAKRKATKGFAFEPDNYMQLELESSFMYEDTPDQNKASEAVKRDMEKPYPMDRLVCGDVGFGKTEIAVRAAFKAVCDSKQVVVLVPTTILALQHYKTFTERLKELPCNVDYLNRFKKGKQKTETLEKLASGHTDIIIGTHAIIGKKVAFKDLGLLIIDEEQKFGVAVKEKLKKLKANVDTLTLTATPIPRTLQFSLMGARDLSIMRTPPPNRQPIQTEVKMFSEDLLKEAIEFEVYRGGQVFFVHNRVKDIMRYADVLRRIVPDMSVGIAHGQLDGSELEKTLLQFIDRKYDVLLCTNIVESGLDIANANTIIVNNAHMFGLSDLHQLRGRVGRSNKKAFCYLVAPPLSTLTPDARKRLNTLEQFSELGSGFQIAMRDLDIRGAGNILGAEQSGFIADIGLNTFQKILDEAIQELKQTEFKELFREELEKGEAVHVSDCQIDTDVEMLIPNSYVSSNSERMLLYTDLNEIENEADLNAFGHLLMDRFGPLPHAILELFDALRIQWLARRIGFQRIILKHGTMRCFFIHNPESPYFESFTFGRILEFIQSNDNDCRIKQTEKNLSIQFQNVDDMKSALDRLKQILTFVTEGVLQN